MLSVAIIFFREILEIALVFTVLLVSTRGLAGGTKMAWIGVLAGTAGACVVAYFASALSAFAEGMGQELFNASVLFLAAILITWHIVWMSQHGRKMAKHFKEVGQSVTLGEKPIYVLAIVMAIAVLREGSEIVLFTYGMLIQGVAVPEALGGGALGLAAGVLTGVLLYYGLLQISPKRLFSVTSGLLILLAAGMVAQAVGFLSAAGWVPELISPLWDTSHFLSEKSLLGKVLHSLIGYSDRPTGAQFIAYLSTLGVITLFLKWFGDPSASEKNKSADKKVMASFLVIFSTGLLLTSHSAFAFPKVYSPIIQKGEVEIEHEGLYTFDKRNEKNRAQTEKFSIGVGVTDRWATEVYGEVENNREEGKGMDFQNVEWENRFQFFEQGQYWFDAGFYIAYEFAAKDRAADKLEAKLLLEKQLGDFVHTANLILEREVDGSVPEGEEKEKHDWQGGVAWSTRYRWKQFLEPGIEVHYDAKELNKRHNFNEQELQVGPALSGKIGPIKYDIGYLFGISDAAPDGVLKWIVEYELRF